MAFKDSLARLLAAKNMKATELSRLSGVTEASISEYLSGKKEPMGKQSIAIARALNVSLDELWETQFAHSEDSIFETEELREVLRRKPGMRILFSTAKNATQEDLLKTVAILKTIMGDDLLE